MPLSSSCGKNKEASSAVTSKSAMWNEFVRVPVDARRKQSEGIQQSKGLQETKPQSKITNVKVKQTKFTLMLHS